MLHRRASLLVCLALVTLTLGCAAGKMRSASVAVAASAPGAAPAALDRSVFDKNPNGQLTEENLQRILASPIELALPSRVGVLPIETAKDWRGPSPDHDVPAGVANFVETLRRDAAFSLVTQTMVIPSGALGMEALREVAARYRLRYLVLYREVLAKHTRFSAWAAGYATLVGTLFLPGQKQEIYGYIEASMFDVKTGLLMFTTRRAITAEQNTNIYYTSVKLDRLASNATSKHAPSLATDLLVDLRRFAAAAIAENEHKGAAPVVTVPGVEPGTPAVATDSH